MKREIAELSGGSRVLGWWVQNFRYVTIEEQSKCNTPKGRGKLRLAREGKGPHIENLLRRLRIDF